MARIWLFQSQEDGSEPSGAAAGVVERYHAGLISQRSRSNRTHSTKWAIFARQNRVVEEAGLSRLIWDQEHVDSNSTGNTKNYGELAELVDATRN